MAANSKREQITQAVIAAAKGVDWCQSVHRHLLDYDEIRELPTTQLPCITVMAYLPQVTQVRNTFGKSDYTSTLKISVVGYGRTSVNHDERISEYADDLFAALFADNRLGNLVTSLNPATAEEPSTLVEEDIFAFRMELTATYQHDNTGI